MGNIIVFIITFLWFICIIYSFIKAWKEYRDEKRRYREFIFDELVKSIKEEYKFKQLLEKSKEWENENRE